MDKIYPLRNEQLWAIICLRNREIEELIINSPKDWRLFAEGLHKHYAKQTTDYIASHDDRQIPERPYYHKEKI